MGRYDRFQGRYDRGFLGYDRGVYGGGYEGYRGGYARHGYDGGGYAERPFLPPQAYRRHPEMEQRPPQRGPRWGYELDDAGAELSDREVLSAVRRRLYEDVWLDVDHIDVEVEDGVVTLTGEVDDYMEARYAWDDAWETEGVRGVVNHLVVRAGEADEAPHGDLLPQSTEGHRQEA